MVARYLQADKVGMIRYAAADWSALEAILNEPGEIRAHVKQLLSNPEVQEAIHVASSGLLRRYSDQLAEGGLDEEICYALYGYLARMSYRATPFGTFAVVGGIGVGDGVGKLSALDRMSVLKRTKLTTNAVWEFVRSKKSAQAVQQYGLLSVNDTITASGDVARYVRIDATRSGKRRYTQVEVDSDEALTAVLDHARVRMPAFDLAKSIAASRSDLGSPEDWRGFIDELIDSQILTYDDLNSFTSDDIACRLDFDELGESLGARRLTGGETSLGKLNGVGVISTPADYERIQHELWERAGREFDRGLKSDLYDQRTDCTLSQKVATDVRDAVEDLLQIVPRRGPLQRFAQKFTQSYGDASVALVDVLDQLETLDFVDADGKEPALDMLIGRSGSREGALNASLVEPFAAMVGSGQHYARAQDYFPVGSKRPSSQDALPIVCWVSLWRTHEAANDLIEIKSIGRQDPGRIMGKFSHDLPQVATYLADHEFDLPTDVILAEILHLPQDSLGSICARPLFGRSFIGLRAPARPDGGGERIDIADIDLVVRSGRVLLIHRRLHKRIRLCMSNAHNFDVPTNLLSYRFLNHVSAQDDMVKMPDLRDLHPSASFVPGLNYRGVVVSRPSWRIPQQTIASLNALPLAARAQAFRSAVSGLCLPSKVALIQADQVIPLALESDWMIVELLRHASRSAAAILTDVSPQQAVPALVSPSGRRAHEIVMTLRLPGVASAVGALAAPRGALADIGSHWCSLNVYASPRHHAPLIVAAYRATQALGDRAVGFFFVRYKDDRGPHLRIRVRLTDSSSSFDALRQIKQEICPLGDGNGSMTVVPYLREVVRYGGDELLEVCERIFMLESEAISRHVDDVDDTRGDYWASLCNMMDSLLRALGFTSLEARLSFAARSSKAMAEEQGFTIEQKKRVGALYRMSVPGDGVPFGGIRPSPLQSAILSADEAIAELIVAHVASIDSLSGDQRWNMLWSLVHMRCNRLLSRAHRRQEAALWDLLRRSYERSLHSTKKSSS